MANQSLFRFAWWQIALAFVLVLTLLTGSWRYTAMPVADKLSSSEQSQPLSPLPLPESMTDICEPHGLRPYPGERRVFDLVLMANELDFLEIRLNSLNDVVDWFVIVTAATTFTGMPKPLYLHESWDRYKAFHHKIIHHVVQDAEFQTSWEHEAYIRNSLLEAAHLAERKPEIGDVLIVSDMDEIPRPEVISMLRKCNFPPRVTLHTRFFYYAFQWKHPNQWYHPQVTTYQGENTIQPEQLRTGPHSDDEVTVDLWDAGWHCSNCFKTLKQVLDKIEGFSHAPEWNTPENREPATIIYRYRHGLDLFGRLDQTYNLTDTNDVPRFVDEHRERFRYMLDRTSETAGFEDAELYLGHP